LLHKIGLTSLKEPLTRVRQQEKANNEKYSVLKLYKTRYFKYLEMIAHRYFKETRVTKEDSNDGKTEWFLVTERELIESMDKMAKALHYMHNDTLVYAPPPQKE
jgi:hypothetical protein